MLCIVFYMPWGGIVRILPFVMTSYMHRGDISSTGILNNPETSGVPPRFERDQSLLSYRPAEGPAEGWQKVLDAQPGQGGFSDESEQDSLGARV